MAYKILLRIVWLGTVFLLGWGTATHQHLRVLQECIQTCGKAVALELEWQKVAQQEAVRRARK